MEGAEAVMGMPPGQGIVTGYSRLLRVLAGLNDGAGFGFLAAHVNASINVPRVRELNEDHLVRLFLQRLQESEPVDRDILRYLVMSGGPADPRRDQSILRSLWRTDPIEDPIRNLMEVMTAERAVSEIWLDGLDLPPLPRRDVSYEGLRELSSDQLCDLLLGSRPGMVRSQVGRWEMQDPPLSAEGVPLWCADLVPPRGVVQNYAMDETWNPLAIMYGEAQEASSFVCPVAHLAKIKKAVQGSVLRFLPSGCASWEMDGVVYAMPASPEIFTPSPSMVANAVVRTELPVIGGQVASLETKRSLVCWRSVTA